ERERRELAGIGSAAAPSAVPAIIFTTRSTIIFPPSSRSTTPSSHHRIRNLEPLPSRIYILRRVSAIPRLHLAVSLPFFEPSSKIPHGAAPSTLRHRSSYTSPGHRQHIFPSSNAACRRFIASPISTIFASPDPPPRSDTSFCNPPSADIAGRFCSFSPVKKLILPHHIGDLPSSALYRNRLSISTVQSPSLPSRRAYPLTNHQRTEVSISTLASSPPSATFVRQHRSHGSVANNPPPFLSVFPLYRWLSHPFESAAYHQR
ncbi:hypothetical protein PIB30_069739, partial [Stylosanthes scabra]|nr:hypothetical protein [Stylosanthes scabra]